jgi:hypothetical protein
MVSPLSEVFSKLLKLRQTSRYAFQGLDAVHPDINLVLIPMFVAGAVDGQKRYYTR